MSVGPVGTTRNRTDLFLKYRNQARGTTRALGTPGSDRGTLRLLDAALASTAENGASAAELGSAGVASALPPRYVDFKEAIRTEMLAIKAKMGELRGLHGKAALTTFDDSGSHEVEIEVLTQDITRLFRKVEARLQQFGTGDATSEADEKVKQKVQRVLAIELQRLSVASSKQQKAYLNKLRTAVQVKQNVQRTLAIELQKLSVAFRKQQKAYLNKLRKSSAASGSFSLLDDAAGPAGRAGGDEDFDPGFSEIQTMRVDTMDAFAQERDREVRGILQSINDLAQIMKDLSVLVIDQGTIVDRIDYNMEQVAVKVDEGVKQLLKAEKSQKQSGMVLCIMFLVVAVIVMLVVYLLKVILRF